MEEKTSEEVGKDTNSTIKEVEAQEHLFSADQSNESSSGQVSYRCRSKYDVYWCLVVKIEGNMNHPYFYEHDATLSTWICRRKKKIKKPKMQTKILNQRNSPSKKKIEKPKMPTKILNQRNNCFQEIKAMKQAQSRLVAGIGVKSSIDFS